MTNHECGSKHQESNKVNSKAGCLVLDLFVCLNSWPGCICTFWRWILFCFFSGLAFRSWSKSFLQDGLFSGCIIGDRMCCAVSPPKIATPICGELWQANQSLTKLIPFGIDIVAVIAIVITKSFSCRMWPYFKGNIFTTGFLI